jgi:hypothetical protein
MAHMISDFLMTTEVIAAAGQSFFDGFEFVRRTNLMLCENSHGKVKYGKRNVSYVITNKLQCTDYFLGNKMQNVVW